MSAPDHRGHSGPDPHQPIPAPAIAAELRVAIRRQGKMVEIVLTSRDDYAAIALYDHLVRSMQQGSLHLDIAQVPSSAL